MCGIAGIFSLEPVSQERVTAMLKSIHYRGPDNLEVKRYRSPTGACLTVGQARLAILDPTPEANQPFDSDDNSSCITFNGEFYNFRVLKQQLEKQGARFRTRSDTELALACLDREGVGALNRLWGMFAAAWFQKSSGKLTLFRDRFGKKPLYLYPHAGRLYFASEPKAILAALDHTPEPDPSALSHYFYLGYIPSGHCAFKGMFKLPAGSFLTIDHRFDFQIETWYKPQNEPVHEESELESIFMDAVAKRMISDVPLGAFLSGGLDSSLVVAAMSRLSNRPINTFSVRFQGPQALDESPYARQVAAHCNTNHHEVVLGVDRLKSSLPLVLDHFDEPFGDSSAIPTYLVSKAARSQFTVALSGDGADEIFAGYRKYLGGYYLKKLGPYPLRKALWNPLSRLLPTGRTNTLLERMRRIRRLLSADGATAAQRHLNLLHMSPISGQETLGPGLSACDFKALKEKLGRHLPPDADLNDCLRFDQRLVLQDDMFVKVDRMSMKASLEVRSPFVDHRLVNLANGLAPERKLNGTTGKWILLQKLGHWLPPEILKRPKTGFEMPLGAWLRSDLQSWTEDQLFSHGDTSDWVNPKGLKKIWQAHRSGKLDCTEILWYHLVFANWLKRTYG